MSGLYPYTMYSHDNMEYCGSSPHLNGLIDSIRRLVAGENRGTCIPYYVDLKESKFDELDRQTDFKLTNKEIQLKMK